MVGKPPVQSGSSPMAADDMPACHLASKDFAFFMAAYRAGCVTTIRDALKYTASSAVRPSRGRSGLEPSDIGLEYPWSGGRRGLLMGTGCAWVGAHDEDRARRSKCAASDTAVPETAARGSRDRERAASQGRPRRRNVPRQRAAEGEDRPHYGWRFGHWARG